MATWETKKREWIKTHTPTHNNNNNNNTNDLGISSAACGRSFSRSSFFLTDVLSSMKTHKKLERGRRGHTRFQAGRKGRKRVGIGAYGNSLRLSVLEHFWNVLLASADFSFLFFWLLLFLSFFLCLSWLQAYTAASHGRDRASSHLHTQQGFTKVDGIVFFLFCPTRGGGRMVSFILCIRFWGGRSAAGWWLVLACSTLRWW